jgi:hypothetical protein
MMGGDDRWLWWDEDVLDLITKAAQGCRCGHPEASHHHLDNCTQDGCRCRLFRPAEEEN